VGRCNFDAIDSTVSFERKVPLGFKVLDFVKAASAAREADVTGVERLNAGPRRTRPSYIR
jgi:hypothetical protein